MTDTVVTLALRDADEAQAFGSYLSRFLASRVREAERMAARMDAPYLMVRDEPTRDGELRHVVFQVRRAAHAFREGWERVCAEARAGLG